MTSTMIFDKMDITTTRGIAKSNSVALKISPIILPIDLCGAMSKFNINIFT